MSFVKFLALVCFTFSVGAAENRGNIDFGVSTQSPQAPIQHPDIIDTNTRFDNPVSEESPSSPEPLPEAMTGDGEGMAEEDPLPQTGSVRRSHFTSGVDNHEPMDHLLSLANDNDYVYFYTDLRNLEGQTITHRWEYNSQVLAEVSFVVKGPRWRVWSKKTLLLDWIGEIKVNVLDEQGRVLASGVLTYTEASQ